MHSMSATKLLSMMRQLLRWDDLELVGERLRRLSTSAWRGFAQSLVLLAGILILIAPGLPSGALVGATSLAGTLALVRALLARSAGARQGLRAQQRAPRDEAQIALAGGLFGLVLATLIAWPMALSVERQALLAGLALIGALAWLRVAGASLLVFLAHAVPLVCGTLAILAALPATVRGIALIGFGLIVLLFADVVRTVARGESESMMLRLRERGLLAQQWALFSTSQLAIALTCKHQIEKANSRFRQLFGEGSGDALLSDLASTLGRSRAQLDRLIQRADTRVLSHRSVALNVLLEGPTPRFYNVQVRRFDPLNPARGLLWSISDQTSEWLRRQALEQAASRDPLTGALNRRAFEQKFRRLLHRDPQRNPLALMCLDLNGFRELNQTHGHALGDQILCVVAKRMQHMLRSQDLIARLQGDTFAVVLEQVDRIEDATSIADKLVQTISAPVVMASTSCSVGVSVGIALSPRDGNTDTELLAHAEAALFTVKRALRRNRNQRWRRSDTGTDPRDNAS